LSARDQGPTIGAWRNRRLHDDLPGKMILPWGEALKGANDKAICVFREACAALENAIAIPAELPLHPCPGPKQKKLLLFFPLPCRFSLDIDETQFYTFINCNLRIAEIDATHRKGE
jgi:hypothetical protein